MPRITSSRCPILAKLHTDHMAALNASIADFNDETIDRVQKTRSALRTRENMFRPRRIRKAERKADAVNIIIRYVGAQDQAKRHHSPLTVRSIEAMEKAAYYRGELKEWDLFFSRGRGHHKEFTSAAREALQWAKHFRLIAAECGRRLP